MSHGSFDKLTDDGLESWIAAIYRLYFDHPATVTHRAQTQATLLAALDTEELPAIAKKKHDGAINYAYRGIEEITGVLQGLLAKHGVTFIPMARLIEVRDIEKGGNPWTRTYLEVAYAIHHSSGTNIQGPIVIGIGDDNQDKGANKAMTQALKYAYLQTFCVADPADDGDAIDNGADDSPSAEGQRVRRTRRTRAQIEADKAVPPTSDGSVPPAVPVQGETPSDPAAASETETAPAPPDGWDTTANAVSAHNLLAKRIVALPADFRDPAMAYRKEHGWPLPLAKFNELEEVVGVAEGFGSSAS